MYFKPRLSSSNFDYNVAKYVLIFTGRPAYSVYTSRTITLFDFHSSVLILSQLTIDDQYYRLTETQNNVTSSLVVTSKQRHMNSLVVSTFRVYLYTCETIR